MSTERPILFSGAMVKAILDERKTQTRRVIKQWPTVFDGGWPLADNRSKMVCPHGEPGDRLWCRETFANIALKGYEPVLFYRADEDDKAVTWKPSIHMPRWASRITLEITEVRVQRVQEISEEDAKAEGVKPHVEAKWWQGYHKDDPLLHQCAPADINGDPPDWLIEAKPYRDLSHLNKDAKQMFRFLWDSINEKRGYGWDANPWTWAITFKRIKP